MDTSEAVQYLAQGEAKRFRPLTDAAELEELDARLGRRIPAFRLERSVERGGPTRAVSLMREAGHDNADRMPVMLDFLNRSVLPLVDPLVDVSGVYRLELHDSYTYLPGRELYSEVLSFGRAKDAAERRVALIPDPYHIAGFGGAVDAASLDPVPWARKEPKLFFAGATTGRRDPALNARVRACMWSLERRDVSEMYITKVAQMRLDDVLRAYPAFMSATSAYVPLDVHFRYRYQVNIAGNTAAWSRLPVMLASRSLVVHARQPASDDLMWYYPLLREGAHYVGADSAEGPDLARALAFCRSYDSRCRGMVDAANAIARDLFHPGTAATYMAAFLEEAAFRGRA